MDILVTVIFIIIIIVILKNVSQPLRNNDVSCKMHKWVDMKQPDTDDTYMICQVCNKTPTEVVNSVDIR